MPDKVDGVLIYGQVIMNLFFNDECFGKLQKSAAPVKTKERIGLLQQKENYTLDDIQLFAKCIRKYTDGYQNKSGEKLPMSPIIRGLMTSPDYSFKDLTAIVKNGFMKNKSIWNELLQIDLRDTLRGIRVPYRIIQGSTDIVTSTKSVAEFVEQCGNECLSLRVLPGNGHMTGANGMNEVLSEGVELTERILASRV
jgi:poly(3-hydroxyalkanoate) synthetase